MDTTNLAGSGTKDDPYSPMRLKDGTLPVETLYGWRFVDKDLAKVGGNYVVYNYAEFKHTGIDINEKGEYIASEAGRVSLSMNKAKGLMSNLKTADGRSLSYCHNGEEAIDAFMNAWGMSASGLQKNDESYSLGVVAGTVIGYTGLTGAASNYHLHLEYKLSDATYKDPLNDYYKNLQDKGVFAVSDNARYLTGIAPDIEKKDKRPAYNDPGIIATILAYNKRNTTNFPTQGYINAHKDVFPRYKYVPENQRIYKLDEQTLNYVIFNF